MSIHNSKLLWIIGSTYLVLCHPLGRLTLLEIFRSGGKQWRLRGNNRHNTLRIHQSDRYNLHANRHTGCHTINPWDHHISRKRDLQIVIVGSESPLGYHSSICDKNLSWYHCFSLRRWLHVWLYVSSDIYIYFYLPVGIFSTLLMFHISIMQNIDVYI